MKTRALLLFSLLSASAAGSCSLLLDFDDVENLPCPCDQRHVCLVAQDTCVRRGSVETYKSCDLGAERPDDLCGENEVCEAINGLGRRCLPVCEVVNYATADSVSGLSLACGAGKTCWESSRGTGVCSEGICNELRQDCPPPGICKTFNGAGVCFTPCRIFLDNPACAGGQICQPIGGGSVTACLPPGTGNIGDVCNDRELCKPNDEGPNQRPLVCAEPADTHDPYEHCHAVCQCPVGANCQNSACNTGAACVPSRPNVDPERMVGLGVCIE